MDKKLSDYINYIKKKNNTNIYIFGAGIAGGLLYDICKDNGIKIKGFCVTDKKGNKDSYKSLPVFSAEELKKEASNILILIGVIERGENKIQTFLKNQGFSYIIPILENILDYDEWSLRRYKSPIIEVTAKIGCAVNCYYCPQSLLIKSYFSENKSRKSEMSFEDFKSYIDKMPANTIVDFSGFVEPFLNSDSIKMMEYVVETGRECTLFTTFRGLHLAEFERLVKIPFKYVCVHTPDENGYANIPMTKEYFEIIKKALSAKKPNGTDFIDVANCQSKPHPDILKITEGKLKIYCEMSDRAGCLDASDTALAHCNKTGAIKCSRAAAMNHFVLLPDGSLALCCNDFGLKHIVGNLNSESYEQIMKGSVMKNLFEQMKDTGTEDIICRKCMFAVEEK